MIDKSHCPFCMDHLKEHSQGISYCNNKNCRSYFQLREESYICFNLPSRVEDPILRIDILLDEARTLFLIPSKCKGMKVAEIFDPWKAEDLERIKMIAERWKKMSVFD